MSQTKTGTSCQIKQNKVMCYRSPKIEVRTSDLGGRGVFAITEIEKDEVVAIKAGHIITSDELAGITSSVGDYALQIHDGLYLGPRSKDELEQMAIFINHSCNPNVGFLGQIVYVAMRNIESGEELCHDYSMERSDDYSLECRCGSDYCRGTITGDDWKRPDLQERYGDRFSSYILEKIKKSK
ncbi:MAG: SET domain-containing protein [Desulfobacteraceae bacterium]|nr:SET domain-containing protein [Desulfobacteraceae bacterium]